MTQTQPRAEQQRDTDPGTGPLLRLAKQGLTTREIAAELTAQGFTTSQSTVSRRLRQIQEERRRRAWHAAMYSVLTLCAVIVALAVVAIAVHVGAW